MCDVFCFSIFYPLCCVVIRNKPDVNSYDMLAGNYSNMLLCALFIYWVHEGPALIYDLCALSLNPEYTLQEYLYRTDEKNQRKCVRNKGMCVIPTFISWQ